MSTAARPADVVEALVERAQAEGALSLEQLRTTFEQAGIGPAEAGAVLRRLTEAGAVLGTERSRPSTPAPARPPPPGAPPSRPPAPPAAPTPPAAGRPDRPEALT